jgi:hypothetical protein
MTSMMRMALATLALAAVGACSKDDEEAQAAKVLNVAQVTQQDRAEAQQIFANRCTPCHGPSGGGDGPASASLSPHPRNFHDATWQKSVDTEHITKIIRFGGAAVGKSPAMPANPDLNEKGAVVAALTARVRSFGK